MEPFKTETIIKDGFTFLVEYQYDEDPMHPRKEFDNLGTMVCWHPRYDLGDDIEYRTVEEFLSDLSKSEEGVFTNKEMLEIIKQKYIILPLFLYDHSGLALSTTRKYPFNCQWDSMQVGWIYCERGTEGFSDEELTNYLEGEVETYDRYLRGEIYRYIVKDIVTHDENDEPIYGDFEDSCWGYDDLVYMESQINHAIEYEVESKIKSIHQALDQNVIQSNN